MARRTTYSSCNPASVEPIIRLWLLRILVPLGGYREFVNQHRFNNDTLAEVIGLGHWIDPETREFDQKAVQSELRQLHQKVERQWSGEYQSTFLRHNIEQLSDLVGLSTTDCKVLEFTVSIHNERLLDDASEWLGDLSSIKVFHALSIILDLPEADIRASLSATGILAKSGLVMMDRRGRSALRYKLDLLSEGFADMMAASKADPISLLRGTVSAAGPAQLGLADYGHIQSSLEILCPYLRNAMATGRRGVNIFLHGAPGTGKSQLARALAKEMGYELFEVASEDADGDPINGEHRLRAVRALSAHCPFVQFDQRTCRRARPILGSFASKRENALFLPFSLSLRPTLRNLGSQQSPKCQLHLPRTSVDQSGRCETNLLLQPPFSPKSQSAFAPVPMQQSA